MSEQNKKEPEPCWHCSNNTRDAEWFRLRHGYVCLGCGSYLDDSDGGRSYSWDGVGPHIANYRADLDYVPMQDFPTKVSETLTAMAEEIQRLDGVVQVLLREVAGRFNPKYRPVVFVDEEKNPSGASTCLTPSLLKRA